MTFQARCLQPFSKDSQTEIFPSHTTIALIDNNVDFSIVELKSTGPVIATHLGSAVQMQSYNADRGWQLDNGQRLRRG